MSIGSFLYTVHNALYTHHCGKPVESVTAVLPSIDSLTLFSNGNMSLADLDLIHDQL